ncbi:MAG: hypothetical protein QNJ44_17545 [Rhodobacter sp.]|nr:hypothetical protein [Rhodobacter sp.]
MTLIHLVRHRPTAAPPAPDRSLEGGDVVPFGQTDVETVHHIINALRAIGETRLLDPFNGGEDASNRL